MAKGKRKEKRVVMTQAKLKTTMEELYWQILRMFLAAASDVYHWKADEVVEFAARTNWYFDAAYKEHTITQDFVDEVIEANMDLIMQKTNEMKNRTEVQDGREGQGAAGAEEEAQEGGGEQQEAGGHDPKDHQPGE